VRSCRTGTGRSGCSLGPIHLALGHWLGVFIDFLIVSFFVFMAAKTLIRSPEGIGKDAVKKENEDALKEPEAGAPPAA